MYLVTCLAVFLAAYLLNILTITIGYHRGIAHKAVTLHPRLQRLVVALGPWVTGLDPKGWVVMHRLHHEHSDTPLDPHSPVNVGLLGIALEQLRSYQRVTIGLLKNSPTLRKYMKDLAFDVHPLTRSGLWYLPYVVHAAIGLTLALSVGWILGFAYFGGMMSHPVQGGLVNALGHAIGGRNFEVDDNSRNNHFAGWLIFGEGYQNNHHRYPGSATFSYRWHELDLGYTACVAMEKLGWLEIHRAHLIPRPVPAVVVAGGNR